MASARRRARQRRRAKSLIGSMREFLTPEVFKQVRNASKRRKSPRWDLHPLLYILLLTTYCCVDSLPEKFLERRLGTFGKQGSPPMIWNTSIVHLTLGFPFCWRFGKGGKATERSHLIHMLRWLPTAALIVADAGYVGYGVTAAMVLAKVFFLIRISSMATFYTESNEPLNEFRGGASTTGRSVSRTRGSRQFAED